MKEIQITREYLKTLQNVYQEKGLGRAILHEIDATCLSTSDRIESYILYPLVVLLNGAEFYGLANQEDYLSSFRKERIVKRKEITEAILNSDKLKVAIES